MIPISRKRQASRSPENGRFSKRPANSSPEEGEVDDSAPMTMKSVISPIPLPPKPSPLVTTSAAAASGKKVPFPFKTKRIEIGKDGPSKERNPAPLNVFASLEEKIEKDVRRARDKPEETNSGSLLSRLDPLPSDNRHYSGRDNRERDRNWDRESRDRDRDRDIRYNTYYSRRSASPGRSPRRCSRSRSPLYHGRHRLPEPLSPGKYTPPSQYGSDKTRERSRGRDRDRERDFIRRGDNDYRRHAGSIAEDSNGRYYRGSAHNDRLPYHDSRRDSWRRESDHDRKNLNYTDNYRLDDDHHHIQSSARRNSPRRSTPEHFKVVSPQPSELGPPQSVPPSEPPPLPAISISTSSPVRTQSPSLQQPQPTTPPIPRPPSSTPPPAPPPDNRLKPTQSSAKPTLNRPDAPIASHSPRSLELSSVSTVLAMANGPETKPGQIKPPESKERSEPPPKMRRRLPLRRSQKLEIAAYGHSFIGCGLQSDYEATTKLGEGTFGEVHKAIHKSTGTVVALKRILMHNEKEGMPVTALREIKILKALKHPCIVNILDMFVVRSTEKDPLSVYMVFPYMDHDLAGLLENERVKLQPSHIKLYMKQLLEGTEYMHRNHILHRDMKAANLLISNDGSLRIADFGLARSFDSSAITTRPDGTVRRERKYTNCVVTRWYRPPELLLGARQYGGEVDIWGIGCVLGEMFTRRPILPGTSDLDQLEKIWYLCGSPNQHNWPYFDQLPGCEGVRRFTNHPRRLKTHYDSIGIPPETVDLLDKLLTINPSERITASQALDHDYFWTDPLPADPKTMPSYEASHEFDKRGHRNQMPPGPQMNQSNQQRHAPGNPQFNNRNVPKGPAPLHYGGGGGDMNRRGPPGPPHSFVPPQHGLPPLQHGPPGGFRNGPPPYLSGPPLHGNMPPHHGPPFQNGPPNQMPGSFGQYGGPPPNQFPPGPPRSFVSMPGRNQPPGPRGDRRDGPRNNNVSNGPHKTLPSNPNLPPKPVTISAGPSHNDRQRGNYVDRRPPGESDSGLASGVLNYD